MQCHVDDLGLSGCRDDCHVGSLDIKDLLSSCFLVPRGSDHLSETDTGGLGNTLTHRGLRRSLAQCEREFALRKGLGRDLKINVRDLRNTSFESPEPPAYAGRSVAGRDD
jgi:hypothetical protein